MQRIRRLVIVLATLILVSMPIKAGWWERLQEGFLGGELTETSQLKTELTTGEIIDGLRAALEKGVAIAVESLGQTDGFFANPKVKIPLPSHLQSVADGLRSLGQEQYADQFELTMNRAAEAAVPEAKAIFVEAIRNMTVEDAKSILDGPDDAATQYFRRVSQERLQGRLLPIVESATSKVGVTQSYKEMVGHLGILGGMVDTKSLDLDGYVTDKALDGLYLLIAEEEKRIREDPVARTSEILKKVFGI